MCNLAAINKVCFYLIYLSMLAFFVVVELREVKANRRSAAVLAFSRVLQEEAASGTSDLSKVGSWLVCFCVQL